MNQESIESVMNSVSLVDVCFHLFMPVVPTLWFKCMYCVWCVKWFGEGHHE